MDKTRRDFFRHSAKSVTQATLDGYERSLKKKAAHWIRPPFAQDELEFTLACTRCGVCIDACANDTLFPLSTRVGIQFAHTPAMDLNNKPCLLCEDWPCVSACVGGALSRLQRTDNAMPARLAYVAIDKKTCLPYQGPECGVCVDVCPVPGAIRLEDNKPTIDYQRCVGCAQCRSACITTPKAINVFSRYEIENRETG